MDVEVRRHEGPAPDPAELVSQLGAEAREVYGWSNGPGDRYGEHAHPYTKLLYCTRGAIDFVLADGRVVRLGPGDRLVLPSGTAHAAVVGPRGCSCVEGKLPPSA